MRSNHLSTPHRMSKHEHLSKRIVSETKKHVVRNKWLSVASTIVIALTFMIASLFIALVAISSRTLSLIHI
mgnify:CR=1 FL=1